MPFWPKYSFFEHVVIVATAALPRGSRDCCLGAEDRRDAAAIPHVEIVAMTEGAKNPLKSPTGQLVEAPAPKKSARMSCTLRRCILSPAKDTEASEPAAAVAMARLTAPSAVVPHGPQTASRSNRLWPQKTRGDLRDPRQAPSSTSDVSRLPQTCDGMALP